MAPLTAVLWAAAAAAVVGELAPAGRGFALGVRAARGPLADLEKRVGGASGPVDGLGERCERIADAALKAFDGAVKGGGGGGGEERLALERFVDARLERLFRSTVGAALDAALADLGKAGPGDAYGSRARVLGAFCALCDGARRPGADWDYAVEREAVGACADGLFAAAAGVGDEQHAASATLASFLAIFSTLASEIQQLQQKQYAPSPPLNVGFAYRVPDTEINVSGGYQQGKGQLQVAAVDDETRMEGDPAVITAPSHGNLGFSLNL